MGKIFTVFNSSISPISNGTGIDFSIINQIFNSLPGKTYLDSISLCTNSSIRVEGQNDNFIDGTEIVGNYRRLPVPHANGSSIAFVDVFQGVTIIDPPQPQAQLQAQAIPSVWTSGNIYNVPFTIPTPSVANIFITGNINNIPSSHLCLSPILRNCTCGAEKVGGGHSEWCDSVGPNGT